ncbi:hypothetical protein SAMN05443662_0382 [Sulfurivirga caldicuralii]|uniref:Uncharacterized protein n=1 Tax=Sulfurivirga caldicuralii TaxID=364032 RepID=A0A1N6DSB2_9GAMM|nr:hypothetical protein [Sulfurivirga caldicuralii]SIN73671.1 hypothetical protein SAMN05443662_0382 [Sulfurivirga caldicuralii]
MNQHLLLFLLAVAVIVVIAMIWPGQKASDDETLNSQDWRIQDLKEDAGDESNDETPRG